MEIEATLGDIDDASALEHEWRSLEGSEQVSFFLSWDWIGSLLNTLPANALPRLMRVHCEGKTVALGLFSAGKERRRRFIVSRVLHLNETGVPAYDSITLEHNGLLVREGFEHIAVAAVMKELVQQDAWDELYVSGIRSERLVDWQSATEGQRLDHRLRWEKPYYYVDLDRIRDGGSTFLESLSSNTRYQVRRAMNLYRTRGPLALVHAASLAEALDWLAELTGLHQAYWRARGLPGAFASDFARRFHHQVVTSGWPRHAVEVVQIKAGDSRLGYSYNFRKGRTLYNYQTGVRFEDDPKLKPGLVCHALSAADACDRGLGTYDLLAGGSQYKRSLTNAEGRMAWSVIQRRRLSFQIENALRAAKTRYRCTSLRQEQIYTSLQAA